MADYTDIQSGVPYLIAHESGDPVALEQITLTGRDGHALNEAWLQDLIFKQPGLLPVNDIDPIFGELIPLCRELRTGAGPVDNLYINDRGLPTIVECKLWRNPQARREVVGQILDYASAISGWDYQTLEQEIGKARGKPDFDLYHFLRQQDVKAGREATFIDEVSRNLRRGRFLLLVVGDGIRERVEEIANFLQQQAYLNFTFGLVELNTFTVPAGTGFQLLVQPRVLAKTVEIERAVVRIVAGQPVIEPPQPSGSTTTSRRGSITEQYFFESLVAIDPQLSRRTGALIEKALELSLVAEPTKTAMMLKTPDKKFNFVALQTDGNLRNYGIAAATDRIGRPALGETYLAQFAGLIPGAVFDNTHSNRFEWTVRKEDGSPVTIAELLEVEDRWLQLAGDTLAQINDTLAAASNPEYP